MSKYLKKIVIAITIFISVICYSTTILADEVVFTKQPVGGTVDINTDFAITWTTNNNNCQYLLQMRDNSNYDWGNADYITSPHKENYSHEFKSDYRIMAICDSNEYYSNSITVSWVKPNNITTANMNSIEIGDLPLGYNNSKTYPISITNTGKYDIISPKLEFGEGYDYCEIIQNKTPHNIKPGETDNTTWSIKPKKGLGIGRYDTYVYLNAKNVEIGTSSTILFWVVESDIPITYEASADTIDFGTLVKGYSKQTDKSLIVKATGTGNLSHVHITRGESKTTFFDIQTNYPTIDSLSAGTNSGKNWTIKLRSGLEPGSYSEQIKIYADEIKTPVIATVKVKITDNNTTEPKAPTTTVVSNKDEPVAPKEEPIVTENNTEENEIEKNNIEENNDIEKEIVISPKEYKEKSTNIVPIIIIVASIVIIVTGIKIFFIRKNKKH